MPFTQNAMILLHCFYIVFLYKYALDQGCPILEIYIPAKFTSNPDQAQLYQQINIFKSTW